MAGDLVAPLPPLPLATAGYWPVAGGPLVSPPSVPLAPVRRAVGWQVARCKRIEERFESPSQSIPFYLRSSVVPVMCGEGEDVQLRGTAFFVARGLLVTARHVIVNDQPDVSPQPGGPSVQKIPVSTSVPFFVMVPTSPSLLTLMKVTPGIWQFNSDVAILELQDLANPGSLPPNASSHRFCLGATEPKVGDECLAIGYADPIVHPASEPAFEGFGGIASLPLRARAGLIEELYPNGRTNADTGMYSLPVFQVGARYDHMMSGGPVFDRTGAVIGVVSSGMDLLPDQEPMGYAAFIALLLQMIARDPRNPDQERNIKQLAEDGVISSAGNGPMGSRYGPDGRLSVIPG